jgi:hypothetical protein
LVWVGDRDELLDRVDADALWDGHRLPVHVHLQEHVDVEGERLLRQHRQADRL